MRSIYNKVFLEGEWRKLVMASYRIDPSCLLPFLPPGTSLDLYQGEAYVSLVGFLFDKTRVMGMTVPGHKVFPEVNLRFYVTHKRGGETRRGVVFIREIVPGRAVAWMANTFYGEHYQALPMSYRWQEPGEGQLTASYSWTFHGREHTLEAKAEAKPRVPTAGSLEEFITEHYWGYSRVASEAMCEYSVKHPRWQLYPVSSFTVDCDFGALYGPCFAGLSGLRPDSVILAEGSEVRVFFPLIIRNAHENLN